MGGNYQRNNTKTFSRGIDMVCRYKETTNFSDQGMKRHRTDSRNKETIINFSEKESVKEKERNITKENQEPKWHWIFQ